MLDLSLTRRAVLAHLGAFNFTAVVLTKAAYARRFAQSSGIRIDVTPLRENAGDPTATWVERELPGAIAHALAGRMPSGPVTIRVDYLTLGPNSGATVHGGSSPDNISGVAIVGSREIPIRATTSYMASPVDQTMIEQSNHARVSALVQALAYWLPSEI